MKKNCHRSQINQPAPSESLSRWESLGNLQLSKEWTLGATGLTFPESKTSQVGAGSRFELGRCIRWSWQICLIPPWILWIWFRHGNEMAVIGHQKARCRGKTKRCWCCKQEPGSWLVVVSFNFFESLLYFDPDILRRSSDLTSLFLNWVQLHIQFSKAFPKEAYWGRTPRFQITEF